MISFFLHKTNIPNLREIVTKQRKNFLEGQKINFPQFSLEEAKEAVA